MWVDLCAVIVYTVTLICKLYTCTERTYDTFIMIQKVISGLVTYRLDNTKMCVCASLRQLFFCVASFFAAILCYSICLNESNEVGNVM